MAGAARRGRGIGGSAASARKCMRLSWLGAGSDSWRCGVSERRAGWLITDRNGERVEVLREGVNAMERYTILAAMGYDPRPVWVIPADEEGAK